MSTNRRLHEVKTKHPITQMDKAQLMEMYRLMYTSRKLDDAEIFLKKQNQAYFQISGAGHEAIGVATAKAMKPGYDWFYLYYRDRSIALTLGMTPYEILLQAVGGEDDPASGGRQMPAHYGHKKYNIVTASSPTGSQYLNAVGTAEAGTYLQAHKKLPHTSHKDEITLATSGEGATSQGDFWESLNTACVHKVPVLFLIEDNGYAISVPVEAQTPGGNVVKLVENFPGLKAWYVDGTDLAASYQTMTEVVAYIRAGKGPAIVHATVTRPYSHSLSDDHIFYRTKKELADEANRDCLRVNEELFIQHNICTKEDLVKLKKKADDEVSEATEKALKAAKPDVSTATKYLYSEDVDPCDRNKFSTEPKFEGPDNIPMGSLINRCISDEMKKNEAIIVFGEDVADCTRFENLQECKGKGGVFKLTQGLQSKYGSDRVFNSPLAESNIIGRAVGMATRGLRPCVEIQFFDYIWTAMNQLRNEMCTLRYRSNNKFSCPMVVRAPVGGYIGGGSIYHSQTGENIFIHTPGLRVVYPSNGLDANGLLRTALRSEDPVLFLEHKQLYYQGYNRAAYPGDDFMIPFGKANVVREGTDLTIVAWGHLVNRSLDVAKTLAKEGKQVEVIDLRTLSPLDIDTVLASVKKTNRVLIAHEEHVFGGFGGEISAQISEAVFDYLDAPVKRIGSKFCWVAYAPNLEQDILPQNDDVLEAARNVLKY